MSNDVYNKVNLTFNNLIDKDMVDFVVYRLSGGEPLLVFDQWKPFIEEFMSTNRDKKFVSLISNMTILTDEMIEFFIEYNIGFGLSLDGYSYSKPFISKKSSAEIVRNNIDRLINCGITKNIDISTVIDSKSFDDLDILAEWIAERDLNWGIYLDHFFCGEIDSNLIIQKMVKVIDILYSHKYDVYNKLKFNNIKITKQYDGCTAGEKLLAIDTDGGIYPCQTAIYDTPISNIMTAKNIIADLKNQKTYKLGYNIETPEACNKCPIFDLCGGGCKMHNKEINKNFTCDIMKTVILYMMKTVIKRGCINA